MPLGNHIVLHHVHVRERHGVVQDVPVPVRLGALDLDRLGVPSRYLLPQPDAPVKFLVRSRNGRNPLGVTLGKERRRETDRLLGRLGIVEGQADGDARAIGIRRRRGGVPRAARVIGAREVAGDEGGKGQEEEGGRWRVAMNGRKGAIIASAC